MCSSAACYTAEIDKPYTYEGHGITFRLIPRTPDQMAAFYEARGFPQSAIEQTRASCFMTVGVKNRSNRKVWLELSTWRFYDKQGQFLRRHDRAYWNNQWERLGVPQANRATFGWTQLPERRDLHPEEPVGGNVGVVPPVGRFSLEARFRAGADGRGQKFTVRIADIECPGRSPSSKEAP